MTLFYVRDHVIPAALSLLPPAMTSVSAVRMLLAIGLQESAFEHRAQVPSRIARGFWQFERGGGVRGVLSHPRSAPHLDRVLRVLRYEPRETALYEAIEHHDVLACVLARLLLWTDPAPLPDAHHFEAGWAIYLRTWRPGKPHPAKWRGYYGVAGDLAQGEP